MGSPPSLLSVALAVLWVATCLVMAVALLAVRTQAGHLSDRVGRRAVVLPALAIVALAMAMLAVSRSAWGVYLAGLLFGLGLGAGQP